VVDPSPGDVLDVNSPVLQPPIKAICLLPQSRAYEPRADEHGRRRVDLENDLMDEFACRFTHSFRLVCPQGLIDAEEEECKDRIEYNDMKPAQRHLMWMDVVAQLKQVQPAGLPIICLLRGPQMRWFRTLGLPCVVPMAGLSERLRRGWLIARTKESNFAVGLACFGGGLGWPVLGPGQDGADQVWSGRR